MFLILVSAGATAVASLASPGEASELPVVVATTSIWADIVDAVDCADHFDVRALIPIGGDAHSYEPSMRDRELLTGAALFVANGGGLEEQLDDTIDAVAGDGVAVLRVVDHVETVPMDEHGSDEEHAGEEHGHDDGNDPHVWFDPTLVADAVPAIAEALVAAGAGESEIDGCVEDYIAELAELDAELGGILDTIPPERRVLVTNHDALGYFARRYGLEILGSVLPGSSTLAESSPAQLEELSASIDEAGVPAIFAENLQSSDEATQLGERLGIEIVSLFTDSLGDEDSGAATYPELMRYDATAIADALS